MSTEATVPLRPGDVVAGKYQVDRLLGAGGMGAVVLARAIGRDDRVAIKVLLPEHRAHEEVLTRFQREARATFRLKGEHVVRVFETGVLESGLPFIVMEYLEGCDLKSLLKDSGPLSVRDASLFVVQACTALAEAHALGIIHRDLKPANLFLTRRSDGTMIIKVLDFGIAKFLSPNVAGDHLDMTRTHAVLGSRAFMAPEQMLRPKDVDARADIWALGVILYYLVTGHSPFRADTIEALIVRVVQDDPQSIAALRGDVPVAFEQVIFRCLAKQREQRFGSVTELRRALAAFAESAVPDCVTLRFDWSAVGGDLGFPSTSTGDAMIDSTGQGSRESWAPTQVMGHRRRHRRLAAVLAMSTLGILFLIAAARLRYGASKRAAGFAPIAIDTSLVIAAPAFSEAVQLQLSSSPSMGSLKTAPSTASPTSAAPTSAPPASSTAAGAWHAQPGRSLSPTAGQRAPIRPPPSAFADSPW